MLKAEAEAQLLKYASDSYVNSMLGNAELKLITVVFRGWEVVDMVSIMLRKRT